MARMYTHRVVGEIVYARLERLLRPHLGAFLLGNVLVDLHRFELATRAETHFEQGQAIRNAQSPGQSSARMLSRLDTLLIRPWEALSGEEKAFVGGYLCHLAADEDLRQFLVATTDRLGKDWLDRVPYSVVMTVFNVESRALSPDRPAADEALAAAKVPDVFTHIDHAALQAMWEIARPYVLDGTAESIVSMLVRGGSSEEAILQQRWHLAEHWDEAVAFAREFYGGVEARVEAMVARAVEILPQLWS